MVERVLTPADGGVTAFDEWAMAEVTPLFELDSANGLSNLRDKQTTTGSATITATGSELKLATGTTASSTATLDTAEKGRYQPGIEGIGGGAIRRPVKPTGNQFWELGYFDDEDGYWIGEDATGLYIRMRANGEDRDKVRPAQWDSGGNVALDLTCMTVFRFPHLCYYGGPLWTEAMEVTKGGAQKLRTLHSFGPVSGEPILAQSKLPVRATVGNGDDESNFEIFVGGRHYGVKGRYNPNRRETAERRFAVSIGTTLLPLISFRKRDIRSEKAKSVKINGVGVLTDTDALVEVHLNATGLTDSNFGAVSDIATAESAVFSDIAATAITPGQVISRVLASGGQANRSNLSGIRRLGLDIPDDATITLAARTTSGTGSMDAVFSLEEEW